MLQFTANQQVGVDPNHDLSYGDQSARRKRSKVSRACDECRRKKVGKPLPNSNQKPPNMITTCGSLCSLSDTQSLFPIGPLRRNVRIRC
jgi:hypothetical protein